DPNDSNYLYVCGVQLHRSKDGGKTFTQDGGNGVHPDQHTLWVDPKDGRHMIVGCDGGVYVTYDRMAVWARGSHMASRQFTPAAAAGADAVSLQLEHAVHPLRAQPRHLLLRRELRIP